MRTKVLFMGIVIVATLALGCLEDAKDIAEGKIKIEGKVEAVDAQDYAYTYHYVVVAVINGPAQVDSFSFKLEDANDAKVIEGSVGDIELSSGTIQFINNAGDGNTAESTDVFSIGVGKDCTGGELKVYYNGNKVGTYSI